MDKPVSMEMNDLKITIEEAVNASRLPPALLEPVFFSYWLQIKEQSREQLLRDSEAFARGDSPDKEEK